jgi:hypothetical protein
VQAGVSHKSEDEVMLAVTAALDLASLVLQSGGSTPMADTTLKHCLERIPSRGGLHCLQTGLHRGQQRRDRTASDGAPAPRPSRTASSSCFRSHGSQ